MNREGKSASSSTRHTDGNLNFPSSTSTPDRTVVSSANSSQMSDSIMYSSNGKGSRMTTVFRSAQRGDRLRQIMFQMQQLSKFQQSQLGPLVALSEAQSRQIELSQEALKESLVDYKNMLAKQDSMKRAVLEELKILKRKVADVSAEKKALVKDIHTCRSRLEEVSAGRDLYKFALSGLETTQGHEISSEKNSRAMRQKTERAKRLAVMNLTRRRDELKRIMSEAKKSSKRFLAVEDQMQELEAKAAVFGGTNSRDLNSIHGRNRRNRSDTTPVSATASAAAVRNSNDRLSGSPSKVYWGISRLSTALRRSNQGSSISASSEQGTEIGLNESLQEICSGLAEGLVLDHKLKELEDFKGSEEAILEPIKAALATSDAKNHELEVIANIMRECCTLIEENAWQCARGLRKKAFGTRSFNECACDVARRAAEAHKQLRVDPTEATPSSIRVFIA